MNMTNYPLYTYEIRENSMYKLFLLTIANGKMSYVQMV